MSSSGKKRRWIPPAAGSALTVSVCVCLATRLMETTGEPLPTLAVLLAGTVLATVLAVRADRALC